MQDVLSFCKDSDWKSSRYCSNQRIALGSIVPTTKVDENGRPSVCLCLLCRAIVSSVAQTRGGRRSGEEGKVAAVSSGPVWNAGRP